MKRIHDKLGSAGLIVAVVALVAALGGSAIAANSATDSKRNNRKGNAGAALAKKYAKAFSLRYSKAFAKRFASAGPAGPPGPAGPAGPKGDNGANGANGQDGSNGSNGSAGQSVAVANENPGANCLNGGKKLTSASGTDYVCNGEDGTNGNNGLPGDPWSPDSELPSGATLTGSWIVAELGGAMQHAIDLSFPVQLAAPLDEDHVHAFDDADFADFDDGTFPGTEGCTGSVAAPTAPSGHLCVYGVDPLETLEEFNIVAPGALTLGAGRAGAVTSINGSSPALYNGTWAVTG